MKKIIIFLLLFMSCYKESTSNEIVNPKEEANVIDDESRYAYDYSRSYYYDGIYLDDNTEYEKVHLIANIDFRHVNRLIEDKNYAEVDKLYKKYIELEKQLKFIDLYKIYSSTINERISLRDNDFNWVFSSIDETETLIKQQINNKSFSEDIFPPSVTRGGLYYIHSETMSNLEACDYLNEKINFEKIIYDGYIEAKSGYVISLKNISKNRPEYFLYIKKVQSKLYPKLNGKFEISAFFWPGGEATADWYSTWIGSTIEKDIIYGTIDQLEPYSVDDECLSLSNNLNIYEDQKKSSKIIYTLNMNSTMNILEIGDYEVINGIGANWLKVAIDDYTGWCFGSFSDISRNYVDTSKMVQ